MEKRPTLFLIFINAIYKAVDIPGSSLLKFADDTKLGAVVECRAEWNLQESIGGLEARVDKWQMEFNASKCHILHIGRNNQQYSYYKGGVELESVVHEKEYAVASWNPRTQEDRVCLEKVQHRAMGMVTNFRAGCYFDKLKEEGFTTLQARREHRLSYGPANLDIRRHFFSQRVVTPLNI